MGGRDKVLDLARVAIDDGDFQWAAELLTWVIRANLDDTEARSLKADALRQWAFGQKNATWRNWGLTAALELEGEMDMAGGGMVLGSPDQVRGFPLANMMRVMVVRLKSEKSWDTHSRVAFETSDSEEACALEIRRGVCQFHETPPADCDATVRFTRELLLKWVFGKVTFADAVAAGDMIVVGETETVEEFLSKFETFNEASNISIAVR
jgi:alkyl sulfatase BDS1-like metallo-beta-lactamase superfamily hydrolase